MHGSGDDSDSHQNGAQDQDEPVGVDLHEARDKLSKDLQALQSKIGGYMLLRQDDARREKLEDLRSLATNLCSDIATIDELLAASPPPRPLVPQSAALDNSQSISKNLLSLNVQCECPHPGQFIPSGQSSSQPGLQASRLALRPQMLPHELKQSTRLPAGLPTFRGMGITDADSFIESIYNNLLAHGVDPSRLTAALLLGARAARSLAMRRGCAGPFLTSHGIWRRVNFYNALEIPSITTSSRASF